MEQFKGTISATIVLAFAMIATAKEFRKTWRPRLRQLGVTLECLEAGKVTRHSPTNSVLDIFQAFL